MLNVYRRIGHASLLASIFAALQFEQCTEPPPAQAACQSFNVTGYIATGNPTADGTPTTGHEWAIAAAHPRIPFDTIVTIDGIGVVRVADRGWLGPNDLDVLVSTTSEAYAITGEYLACYPQ